MKNRLTYIDDKRFYYRIFEEQDAVILFQKIGGMPLSTCDSLSEAILDKISRHIADTPFAITDLHQYRDIKGLEEIERTLYVRIGENDLLLPSALIPTIGLSILTLKDNQGKEIVRIERDHQSSTKYIWIAATVVLCASLVIIGIFKYNDSRRIESNNQLYHNDIEKITNSENILNQAISDNNTYTPFISSDVISSLTKYFSLMREQAKRNLNGVEHKGNYTSINLPTDSINNVISSMVSCAKTEENKEIQRKSNNQAAYDADRQKISAMKSHLQEVISENDISGKSLHSEEIREINSELENLENSAGENFSHAQKSGIYQQVTIDTIDIKNRIDQILQRIKVDKSQTVHRNSQSTSSSVKANTTKNTKRDTYRSNDNAIQRFNQLVQTADGDYKLFYRKKDKAAARRAISNYNKALDIKQDADVVKRKNQLKKALE